ATQHVKKISISFILVFIAAFPLFAKENVLETRCGWFHNPSPANITLYDRDGEWILVFRAVTS
ncbi:PF13316 domain protein, partial [Leptospira interrogans serovar Bataviae str. HAI135]